MNGETFTKHFPPGIFQIVQRSADHELCMLNVKVNLGSLLFYFLVQLNIFKLAGSTCTCKHIQTSLNVFQLTLFIKNFDKIMIIYMHAKTSLIYKKYI